MTEALCIHYESYDAMYTLHVLFYSMIVFHQTTIFSIAAMTVLMKVGGKGATMSSCFGTLRKSELF